MVQDNILFILVDQWPAEAFGHRGADFATPNLDRLAAQGTVFTNAFTSCPLCTPARGALLTARWPPRTGVFDNYATGYSRQDSLALDHATWIDHAAGRGFHVGYFGKWHLGPVNPEARGAHRFDPSVETGRTPYDPETSTYTYRRCKAEYERAAALLVRGCGPFWGETRQAEEEAAPAGVMRNGVRFLEEWAAGERANPFFLTVSSNPPHFPHHLPREYAEIADHLSVRLPESLEDTFAGKPWFHNRPWWPCMDTSGLDRDEWRTVIAYTHAHIMMVDKMIGRVLDALERLGLAHDTTVVFAADHGDMAGAHNRFDKGPYFYDEVWRIPLIIRRPGAKSAVQDAFVSILDVGETLFKLTGAVGGAGAERDGHDLLPLVGMSEYPPDWPQAAYGVYDLYNGMSFAVRAVRDERWKYVWNPQAVDELYDLEADPHEMTNLANRAEFARIVGDMRDRLMHWLQDVGDPLPEHARDLPPAGTILATGKPGP
ncbi:MAG: sulfatase-like hydrolase/transferase [Kiritimatiellaeota bacterium]|nr:sulfatase-like hydrolase/transferase [Kiritimatiellota bacterium]